MLQILSAILQPYAWIKGEQGGGVHVELSEQPLKLTGVWTEPGLQFMS